MEKTYKINKKQKKELLHSNKKNTLYWQESKVTRFIFLKIFIVAPIIVALIATWGFHLSYAEYDMAMCGLLGMALGLCIAFFTWMAAAFYFKYYQSKTFPFCVDYGKEILILKDD